MRTKTIVFHDAFLAKVLFRFLFTDRQHVNFYPQITHILLMNLISIHKVEKQIFPNNIPTTFYMVLCTYYTCIHLYKNKINCNFAHYANLKI